MAKLRAPRKKPLVFSSDESDGRESLSPPPERSRRGGTLTATSTGPRVTDRATRSQAQARAVSPKPSKAATTKKSPTKKAPAKSPAKSKPIYKPITSFFSNVPRSQSTQPTPSPEKYAASIEDVDDILDSDDDNVRPTKSSNPLPVRKRPIAATAPTGHGSSAISRQKFLRTATGARSTPPLSSQPAQQQEVVDRRPWTEKYGPESLDELAVHKRKVADVRTWLSDVFNGKARKRLLLLKGPAGSGKTTTISLLSKELGIEMQEWKNPTGSMSTSDSFVSVTAQFEDFVARTGTFGSLAFDEPVPTAQTASPSSQVGRQKQLVLVEEFPNTFTRTSSAVQSFRSSVLNYLAANTQSATAFFSSQVNPEQAVTPIVMIISETLLSTNTAAADSFTAHRLLGPDILTHAGVSVIEFNPIAPTYMTKALDTIIVKEARKSGRKKTLGPQAIQRLAELGDIRSAVSSLEFLCLRGDDAEGWGANVNFSKKKALKDTPMTKIERESLEMVTQRESTLGIFHSVGRVVYNKRLTENHNEPIAHPPNWFPEKRRPKVSEVNVDTLINELGTDTQTFVAALHENYVLSCGGADSEETMDSIEGCIDALSDADLLSPDRFGAGAGRRNLQGTSADNLRQDEMCFQTGVRGLLFNLPHPVKRVAPPPGIMGIKAKGQGVNTGAAKGNAFVMYYPASLRIWKQQEEIGGLLDMWVSRAQSSELFSTTLRAAKATTAGGGVHMWKRSAPTSQPASTQDSKYTEDDASPSILLGSGGSARYEMLLERLPYLTIILRKLRTSSSSSTAATVREIQKITSFTGNAIQGAEEEDDGEDDVGPGEQDQWTTDKPGVETPRKKRRIKFETKEQEPESAISGLVDKGASLVLSDDDIED
ncbi:cell cycle checkpoint protein RAD17 [Pyrenophora tritici-repentis]|uniref:Cell cycle checkpoint protein RAD17 n=1 Tax=Pyrenophora tritici-repentis TaxID=45151 RepID=A0A316ZX79_9PLEO|nr:cell cycle checkpoint protein RAD17 [Pyrenophora tritici-repentis]